MVHLETDVKYRGVTGAVLIFLPGLADITELYEMLQSDQRFNDKRYHLSFFIILTLFSENVLKQVLLPFLVQKNDNCSQTYNSRIFEGC